MTGKTPSATAERQEPVLRPLAPEDVPAIGEFFVRNDTPETERHFAPFPLSHASALALGQTMPGDLFFGAYRSEILVGFSMLRGWADGHRRPSFGLLVDSRHRGQGIGSSLTEFTLRAAREIGASAVRLTVYASNAAAIRLYERLGFRETERSPVLVGGDGDERIVMTLGLARPVRPPGTRPLIPVATPSLTGNEKRYVLDCLETNWISSNGPYVERFEEAFAAFCGTRHAISCCNGSAALHVALLGLGVGPGDEVIVPTLTYIASANAVTYCGATPVFVDSEPRSWNMDPAAVAAAVTPRTRAILAVHLYGHPVDMDPILAIARHHALEIVEDAAEAHGAEYRGRRVGGLGKVSTFSFYGNKILSTGEGGMVCTDDDGLATRIRILRGQGQDLDRRYWFQVVGYNYRMTNLAAAIGLGQLEQADWHLARRRQNAIAYRRHLLADASLILTPELPWARNAFWMNCVLLPLAERRWRDSVMARLFEAGVETRPFFYPMHAMPPYRWAGPMGRFPVAEQLAARGISLPSSAVLGEEEIEYVCQSLLAARRDCCGSGCDEAGSARK